MNRDRALFDGSRLYRQASEAATELLLRLRQDPARGRLHGLEDERPRTAERPEDLDELIQRQVARASATAAGISSYHALPILAEAIDHAYYAPGAPAEVGPALKVAFSFAFPGVFASDATPRSAALADLHELVRAAGTLDQLYALRLYLEVATTGALATLTGGNIRFSEPLHAGGELFRVAFGSRGRGMRLAKRALDALTPLNEGIHAVLEAAEGIGAASIPFFAGSPFATIPGASLDFWSGLLARLLLLGAVSRSRLRVTAASPGIGIFGPASVVAESGINRAIAQDAMQAAFWNPPWLHKQSPESYRHLCVRRPAARFSLQPQLFVSSVGICMDAVATYIEDCFHREPWTEAAALPPEAFREALSAPFERTCAELLASHGFVAGPVSEAGMWTPINGPQAMLALKRRPPPGEIDVLGVDLKGRVLVLEAKVLAVPCDSRRLRNLATKLGPEDSEGFRAKLRRKVEWVTALGIDLTPKFDGAMGILVLDRPVPFDPNVDGDQLVVTEAGLDSALRALTS